jgi:hypothetical protein
MAGSGKEAAKEAAKETVKEVAKEAAQPAKASQPAKETDTGQEEEQMFTIVNNAIQKCQQQRRKAAWLYAVCLELEHYDEFDFCLKEDDRILHIVSGAKLPNIPSPIQIATIFWNNTDGIEGYELRFKGAPLVSDDGKEFGRFSFSADNIRKALEAIRKKMQNEEKDAALPKDEVSDSESTDDNEFQPLPSPLDDDDEFADVVKDIVGRSPNKDKQQSAAKVIQSAWRAWSAHRATKPNK